MKDVSRHLDTGFADPRSPFISQRPPKGWLRAVRDALGMTTAQLARRLGVSQPRVVELEQAEVSGSVTLNSLRRAAEALGCRVVYTLVPDRPLADVVRERAERVADRQLAYVRHTMLLENQSVDDKRADSELRERLIEQLLRKPARLWDDP